MCWSRLNSIFSIPPNRDQVFKCRRLWRTFSVKPPHGVELLYGCRSTGVIQLQRHPDSRLREICEGTIVLPLFLVVFSFYAAENLHVSLYHWRPPKLPVDHCLPLILAFNSQLSCSKGRNNIWSIMEVVYTSSSIWMQKLQCGTIWLFKDNQPLDASGFLLCGCWNYVVCNSENCFCFL